MIELRPIGTAPGDRILVLTWLDRAILRVQPLEAVHGTPILDVKPVLRAGSLR